MVLSFCFLLKNNPLVSVSPNPTTHQITIRIEKEMTMGNVKYMKILVCRHLVGLKN